MADYISRDDALLHSEIIRVYSKDYGNIDVVPVEYLADIPSADVQPVKRGKWESSQRTIETGTVYCSNCEIEYYVSDLQTVGDCNGIVHYCPNCGAKMIKDGDTE